MSVMDGRRASRTQAVAAIRDAGKLLLVTHERPDGDAIGTLAAMSIVLTRLGKEFVSHLAPDELPLPLEYRWIEVEGLVTELPADLPQRTTVFLDCGNERRVSDPGIPARAAHTVNLDHHHDNTCFAQVNHVVPEASSTAEIVWDMLDDLGVELDRRLGEALYVGLVTDTGRFMYENTTARAHQMAGEIIEAGVDAHEVYRRLYEGVPAGKLTLLARGLSNLKRFDGGMLTVSELSRRDFEAAGADESYAEGVIDHLRALEGTAVAGLVRELVSAGSPVTRKVSLRATDDRVDVSRIARAMGGGGHRRAAGFSTELDFTALVEILRREVGAQL